MSEVIPFAPRSAGAAGAAGKGEDRVWAVVAQLGKASRIAEMIAARLQRV